jgi:glycosyltransferase involved in cell wall biosynthesis
LATLTDARVLVLHNRYQQPGGEDVEMAQEVNLLQERGHQVRVMERLNSDIRTGSFVSTAQLFATTVWSTSAYRETKEIIEEWRPDIVHVHNFLPLLSPSVYRATWASGLPIVQSLHNYRLICPGTLLRRDGRICEDCVGRTTWRGTLHACYRDSHAASFAVSAMLESHRVLGTWRRVEAYIALSEFQRTKLIAGGLPAERLHIKPNCVAWDFQTRTGSGSYALYVGRLSPEKGIQTAVEAWAGAGPDGVSGLPLKIVGSGPLRAELQQRVSSTGARVEFLGFRSRPEIAQLLMSASFLVYPSELFEPLGISVLEAYAAGVPVLASRIGALEDIVMAGRTGAHFVAGDAQDLRQTARELAQDKTANVRMGEAARQTYLEQYTPARNYEQLLEIYAIALKRAARAA